MKQILITLFFTITFLSLSQAQFKNIEPANASPNHPFDLNIPDFKKVDRTVKSSHLKGFSGLRSSEATPSYIKRMSVGHFNTANWISTKPIQPIELNRSVSEQGLEYIQTLKNWLNINDAKEEFQVISDKRDDQNKRHIKYQQYYKGIPIDGAEIIAHSNENGWYALNGSPVPTPLLENMTPSISEGVAQVLIQDFLGELNVVIQEKKTVDFLSIEQWNFQLVIDVDKDNGTSNLAWKIDCRPNFKDHYIVLLDAQTSQVLNYHNHICSFINHDLINYPVKRIVTEDINEQHANTGEINKSSLGNDGPSIGNGLDLLGSNRTVNGYSVGGTFFMIDATKEIMYQSNQSVMPNEPTGVIWTIDANGTSPELDNFSVGHVANNNNSSWKALEVSAHHNGGEAFEYFLNTFGRNSINGNGGNIVSIINVVDKNENEMDNAFWNGVAMYYGNGIEAFNSPLARALDVAGHEMSHGVIQNTANLEYVGQSGALNESFADIFGAMIDRDDWQMGEHVVNTNIFTTGALRDLSNPNNGGNQLGDPGWQPKHMNEYANLPNTPQGDNGGVHINSGIVNHAFFKFATAIGKDKAEQVYFKALDDYLVKSSQFVDARNAIVQAADDLYGTTEVNAAKDAFEQVGIGEGSGGNFEEELNTNPGEDVVICTDVNANAFYYIPPSDPDNFIQLTDLAAPLSNSRMSMSDDGSEGVYVDENGDLRYVLFNWTTSGLNPEIFFLENNPLGGWRSVVISKDGSKIAYLSGTLENKIYIYDFNLQDGETYELFNPTTANGGNTTGDVQYADAMEFDYSGELLIYDALNKIGGTFGNDIEYWDISFMQFWNNSSGSFTDPQIGKLFTSLPAQVSVGNPTFAKNSPFIIAFDFIKTENDIFGNPMTSNILKAANLETGRVSDVFNNSVVSWPSYSRLDDKIVFDAEDGNGDHVLATIDMEPDDKIVPVPMSAFVFVPGGAKGTWSQTGERSLNVGTKDEFLQGLIEVYPNPTNALITIEINEEVSADFGEILNQLGQVVHQFTIDQSQVLLSLESLPTGMYLVKIQTDKGLFAQPILKQSR